MYHWDSSNNLCLVACRGCHSCTATFTSLSAVSTRAAWQQVSGDTLLSCFATYLHHPPVNAQLSFCIGIVTAGCTVEHLHTASSSSFAVYKLSSASKSCLVATNGQDTVLSHDHSCISCPSCSPVFAAFAHPHSCKSCPAEVCSVS